MRARDRQIGYHYKIPWILAESKRSVRRRDTQNWAIRAGGDEIWFSDMLAAEREIESSLPR